MVENIDNLLKLAYGFSISKILFTAVSFDVFTKLSGTEKTAAQLSQELSLPERSFSRLLNSCTALGLLNKKDGRYSNTPLSEEYLVEGKPFYFGYHINALNSRLYGPWGTLEEIIKKDEFQPSVEGKSDDIIKAVSSTKEFARKAMMSQHNYSQLIAIDFAETIDLTGRKSFLDIGGGTGIFTAETAKRFPHIEYTIFDRGFVLEVAKDILKEHKVEDKVKLCEGDILNDPFPEGSDVALLSGVLDGYDEAICRDMIKKIYDYLPKGGLFYITESVINDERSGPVFPSIFSLILLLQTEKGDARSRGEMEEWLRDAGFKVVKYEVMSKRSGAYRNSGLITAVKE
ncbi:MAG: methyltransferase domain-containing protein [Candidatus Schekmanbacteria bacterium]|nr:MAG: methyltransferase domain-containing protein [Candidatus Schekmanbacteria bacterium]